MATSTMYLYIGSIAGFETGRALEIDIIARPRQLQAGGADKTEFVICDHTIDSTYIRLRTGWMFLVVVLDWFSRSIVRWALDDSLELAFVLDAARRALVHARPEIWNTDQGSQFTSPQFTQLVLNAGVRLSMDGKGRA